MMSKNKYTPKRSDRSIRDEVWMHEMLRFSLFCTVATVYNNQPFLRPSAFLYSQDDNSIYIHGAHEGRTIDNMEKNSNVCICVYEVGAFRMHERAFEFFQEQAGVMVFGTAEPLLDCEKKHTIMQATFEKYTPQLNKNVDYIPASVEEINGTTVLQIKIDKWSGKMKWTDDPNRNRFYHEDVRGSLRPRLPWTHDMTNDAPLTLEWERSRKM